LNQRTIVKPKQGKVFHQDNIYCFYNDAAIKNFSDKMLDSQYWQDLDAISGTAQGRGTTWFIQYNQQDWVLRHYYRGGMIGKVNKDKYLFHSLDSTRAAREYQLLDHLNQLSLPAPKPIAYRVTRSGPFYQADLITEKIADAEDLVALLSKQSLPDDLWQQIGSTIRAFHNHGIYHHDLNAHNILLDKHNKVWIIDFDRGEQRSISESWQQSNLSRLLRSFKKEQRKLNPFNWHNSNWSAVMSGYQLADKT